MLKFYKLGFFLLITTIIFGQQNKTKEERIAEVIVKGDIIARLDKNYDPEVVAEDLPANYGVQVERILSKPADIWLFKFDTTQIDEQTLAREFYSVNGVVDAQINTTVTLRNAPNDPDYGSQWQHQNIDSEDAWQTTTGGTNAHGEDIVVCIIESADVMGHPDLVDNHWVNTEEIPGNGIDDDGNGYVDDYNGWNVSDNNDNIGTGNHGTQVAGMIGAKGNNGVGVAGANWDVKMMVVAGHNPNSQANIVECYSYPLEQRLLYNQTNGTEGAFVVATNASWGLDYQDAEDYPIWCNFYDDMGQAGILNCGATANNDVDIDEVGDVPTGCTSEYMVAVTATDQSDVKTFAGYGINSINVAAPGDGIYTTNNGGYGNTQGTSFASPLTAGVIGLLYSIPCPDFMNLVKSDPEGAAQIVRDALYDGVDQTTQLQSMVSSGGRINANNSMDILLNSVCGGCVPPFDITTTPGENSIDINFSNVEDADNYIVMIRESGSSQWDEFVVTDENYTFTGLESCTEYEIAVVSECEGDQSGQSQIIATFTTDCGTCVEEEYCKPNASNPVTRLSVHSPASSETIINGNNFILTSGWGADVSNGYNYGNLVLVDDGTANGHLGCDNLVNGNDIQGNIAVAERGDCNFSTKALNAQIEGATAMIIINNEPTGLNELGAGAGAGNVNIPVIMISQNDGADILNDLQNGETLVGLLGSQNEYIDEFILAGEEYITGDDDGYRDASFNHQSFFNGQNVSFTLKPGFDGQPLETYTRIWIDLDEDGSFDANELVYDQETSAVGNLNDEFEIPASTSPMKTRMRVQMLYQGPDANPLSAPCENLISGEVEDYCIEVKEAIADIDNHNQGLVNIFPNPTKDVVTIETKDIEVKKVFIYDNSGKLVMEREISTSSTELNVSKLSKGLYNIRLMGNENQTLNVSKLSVQ